MDLRRAILTVILMVPGVAAPAAASAAVPPPLPDPAPTAPSRHQDSLRLTRLTAGVMAPDGLLTVGLAGRTWSTVHLVPEGSEEFLERVSLKEIAVLAEAALLPWLQVEAEVPWRTWSGGKGWIPATGSGLADGAWQVAAGRALWPGRLHAVLFGGGNLPVGDTGAGLGEGVFSPRAGAAATFRFWTDAQVPELRIHLNAAHTWNRNEDAGYGSGTEVFQPWRPLYQSAAAAGGSTRNDAWTWGVAVEFRKQTTALWVEFAQDRFRSNATVTRQEDFRTLGAGLRWGVAEGWAVEGDYLVSLADDDANTEWWPAYPDWLMGVGLTKQFSVGGRDRDGDGIVDRRDACPEEPEDHDGFRDDDGCPDYDNDGDGIADRYDQDPYSAEDFDGFEDEDGRPDPDNDGDGILDRDDLCPDEPEDLDGHHDGDGCPDELLDTDGDGVEDGADACPDTPEDQDGFEDGDGCPESDNDLDGIPDDQDGCPDAAEDYDGDADEDGCPDGEAAPATAEPDTSGG